MFVCVCVCACVLCVCVCVCEREGAGERKHSEPLLSLRLGNGCVAFHAAGRRIRLRGESQPPASASAVRCNRVEAPARPR